jgi:hypothetical protein
MSAGHAPRRPDTPGSWQGMRCGSHISKTAAMTRVRGTSLTHVSVLSPVEPMLREWDCVGMAKGPRDALRETATQLTDI